MADGPRCKRRKQANPRRNNVPNHSSAAEPSSDSDDEDRLHIVEEDSLGDAPESDAPESDANVLEANAAVLTPNREEQDALCEEGDLGSDAQKKTRLRVKKRRGSEGVGLQDGDTPSDSPEAPEDEAQLGTPETSGHDENGVPDTFPQLLSCPYCSRGYKRYASLKEHIKYRHEKSDDNYCCSLCSYTFPHRTQLDRHMTAHKPSREQRVHVAPSSGNRKFKCSECSKAFKYKHHLKEHLRIHSGEKPYECSHCKKRFSHSGSYSSHISSKKCFGPLPVNGRPRPGAKPSPCPSPCPSPVASPSSPGRPLPRDKADPGKPLQEQLPLTQIKAEPSELEYKPVLLASAVNNVGVCNGGPSLQPAQAPPPAVVQAVVLPTVGLVSPISIDLRELQSVLKLAVDGTVLRQVLQSAHQNATKETGGGPNTTATPTHSVISAISLPIVDQDGTTKIIINYSLEPSPATAKPASPSHAHPTQPSPAQAAQPNHALPTQRSPTLLAVPNHTHPTQTSPTQPAPPSQAHLTQPGPTQNTALNHAQPTQPSPTQSAPTNHAQPTQPSPTQPAPTNHAQPTQPSPTQPAPTNHAQPTQPSPTQPAPTNHAQPRQKSLAQPAQLSPIQPKSTYHAQPSPTQLAQPSQTQKLCSAQPAMENQTPPTALEKVDMPPQDPTQKAEQIKKVEPLSSDGAGLTDREGTCLLCDSCPGGLDALHALKHCSSDTEDPPTMNGEQDPEHHTPESLALSALLSDGLLGRPPLRNLLSLLKAYFALNAEPTGAELADISQSVSLPPDVVKRWFHKMQSEQISVGGPIGEEGQAHLGQSPSASEGGGAKTNLPTDSTSSLLSTESDAVEAQSSAPLAPPDLIIVKTEEEEEGDGQAEPLDLSLPRRAEGVGPVGQQGGVYAEQEEPLNLSTGRKESQLPAQMLTQTLAQLKTGDTIFVTPNSTPVSIVTAQLPTIVAISDRTALPCLRAITAVTTNKQTILIPQLTYTYTTTTTATPAKPVAAARDTSPHGNSPQDERQDTGSEGQEEQNDCDSAPPRRKMRKTESGMYACDLCDKIFQKSSSLLRHKYEHTGKRPHECGVCRKAFKHKHHLIEHTRLHSGEKPYQCDKCRKRFSHSGSYSQHMNHRYSYCKREAHRGGAAPPTDGRPPAQPDSDEREEEDSEEEEGDEEGVSEDEIQVVQVGEEGEDSDEEWREEEPEEEGEGPKQEGEEPGQEGDELEKQEQGLDKGGEGPEQEVGDVPGGGKVGGDEAVLGGDAQVEEVTVETEDSMEMEQMGGEEGLTSASSERDRSVQEDTDGK